MFFVSMFFQKTLITSITSILRVDMIGQFFFSSMRHASFFCISRDGIRFRISTHNNFFFNYSTCTCIEHLYLYLFMFLYINNMNLNLNMISQPLWSLSCTCKLCLALSCDCGDDYENFESMARCVAIKRKNSNDNNYSNYYTQFQLKSINLLEKKKMASAFNEVMNEVFSDEESSRSQNFNIF